MKRLPTENHHTLQDEEIRAVIKLLGFHTANNEAIVFEFARKFFDKGLSRSHMPLNYKAGK